MSSSTRIEVISGFDKMPTINKDSLINKLARRVNELSDLGDSIVDGMNNIQGPKQNLAGVSVLPNGGANTQNSGPPATFFGKGVTNTSGRMLPPGTVVGYNSDGALVPAVAAAPASWIRPAFIVQNPTKQGTNFFPNSGILLYVRVTGSWDAGGVAWLSTTAGTVSAAAPSASSVRCGLGVFANSGSQSGLALMRPQDMIDMTG